MSSEQRYLTTEEAATYLGLSRQWLEAIRCRGGGPIFVKLGRYIRYDRLALDEWMGSQSHASSAEYPTTPGAGRPRMQSR